MESEPEGMVESPTEVMDGQPEFDGPTETMDESDAEAVEAVNETPDTDAPEGQSIEDMAAGEEAADGAEEGEQQQQLLDFGDELDLSMSGRAPTDSELKIKAVSRPIRGQLGDHGDDEMVTFLVRARLDKVELVNKRDNGGHVVAKIRRHLVNPISVTPISEAQADQIDGG